MKILGIDLGGSRVKLAIVDDGRVQALNVFPIRSDMPTRVALDAIAAQAGGMAGIAECRGIGLAYPGIVDMQEQRVLCINDKYTDAAETDFAGWAKERFGLELLLINDAAAALCGEMHYGAGRGCDSAVLMIHGEKAHSCYMSRDAFKLLKGGNKELLIIPGAVHTDLYDRKDVIPFDRIQQFMEEHLK